MLQQIIYSIGYDCHHVVRLEICIYQLLLLSIVHNVMLNIGRRRCLCQVK